ncbi:MAG TPA: EamA family transporter [Thermomicrobiales bacterium]|nr:EamA family transporter [Thermomicrobiales bacterium]
MPAGAVGLVAIAAVCHASWNLITKRTGGGIAFLWLFGITATILMLPVAWIEVAHMDRSLQRQDLIAVLGSGFIHIFYFSLLQNGYRTGDLSVVYPVARGVGPLLAAIISIAVLGDRPGAIAVAGGLALLAGVVGMSGLTLGKVKLDQSVVLGLLTGVSIACYTLWDRRSVTTLELPPVFYYWASTAAYTMFVTPAIAKTAGPAISGAFVRDHWRPAAAVALLSAASYSLVLTAMTMAPLSYVATLRESSILVATVLGIWLLGESITRRKVIAAGCIVLGVVGLAVG